VGLLNTDRKEVLRAAVNDVANYGRFTWAWRMW